MKRLSALLLCGLMLLAGCSSSPAPTADPETKMTPGTYSSVGTGFKGDIKLDVTVTEDAITEIKVVDHKETKGIGSEAVTILAEKMVEYQTTGVDLVAGATVTSAGFRTAVNDALNQAGADMNKFGAAPEKAELKDETLDTDVVVVGGGSSGMMAAQYLAKDGYKVILLEKTPMVGGASAMAGGTLSPTNTT